MKTLAFFLILALSLLGKEVSIGTKDGFKLYGWLDYPTQKAESYPLAFFAHQFGADHTIWNDFAAKLRRQGFATFMVDLRGHGKSVMQNGKKNAVVTDTSLDHIAEALAQSREKVNFKNIPKDLSSWLDYADEIENIDMQKLVLFGSSLGAGAILPLMIDYEPVAVVAISPGGGNTEDIKTSLTYSGSPSLFIAGKNDPLGAQKRALAYANEALRGTYLMISSDGHGTVLLPKVENYIMDFLHQNLEKIK